MFSYYLNNAFRSIRRNPALSALVVAAIAVGIGVSITMLTLYYVMGSNPIPSKSDKLFAVQLDSWNPIRPFEEDRPERAPHQVTWRDSQALLAAGAAKRQTAMFESMLVLQLPDALPFEATARVANSDFFPMFEVPFKYGGGWSRQDEENAAPVIVLTKEINDRLFGGENSVGEKISVNNVIFTISGVMDYWAPVPRFYDVINNPLQDVSEVFIPLAHTRPMQITSAGSDWGWKSEDIVTFDDWLNSESVWLQFWAELDTKAEQDRYLAHLDAYVGEQKLLGRFERPLNNHIHDVMAWMRYHEVIQSDVKVLVGLGFLFLVVCLLSSISLLLTKFSSRAGEMSLRRALGANRVQIVLQNLVEVAVLGAFGGLFGAGLTQISLLLIKAGIGEAPDALFHLDWLMITAAIGIAVTTSLIAGIYPAIRACAVTPAQQLKT